METALKGLSSLTHTHMYEHICFLRNGHFSKRNSFCLMQMPSITSKFRRLWKSGISEIPPPPPKVLKALKINLKKTCYSESFSKADKLQTWCSKTLLSSDLFSFCLSIYFNIPFHGLTFIESWFHLSLLALSRRSSGASGSNLWFTFLPFSLSLAPSASSPSFLLTSPQSEWTVSPLVTCSFGIWCWQY